MPELSAWVESTWISKTLFGISWLWPVSEALHFIGLCMLIGGAGLLDLRLMGLFRGLAIRHVKALMPWAIGRIPHQRRHGGAVPDHAAASRT